MKKKRPSSGRRLIRFRMMKKNCPTVKSFGTKYFLFSRSGKFESFFHSFDDFLFSMITFVYNNTTEALNKHVFNYTGHRYQLITGTRSVYFLSMPSASVFLFSNEFTSLKSHFIFYTLQKVALTKLSRQQKKIETKLLLQPSLKSTLKKYKYIKSKN